MGNSKYPELIPIAISLYRQKTPIKTISKILGIPPITISRWLEKAGERYAPHSAKFLDSDGSPMESALTPKQCDEMHVFLVITQWLYQKNKKRFSENLTNLMKNWDETKNELLSGNFGIVKKERDSIA